MRPNHLDGMEYCLKLIEDIKHRYYLSGLMGHDLTIEHVLIDIENEIGCRCIKDWRHKNETI